MSESVSELLLIHWSWNCWRSLNLIILWIKGIDHCSYFAGHGEGGGGCWRQEALRHIHHKQSEPMYHHINIIQSVPTRDCFKFRINRLKTWDFYEIWYLKLYFSHAENSSVEFFVCIW